MVGKVGRVAKTSRREAAELIAKAEQFLDDRRGALDATHFDTALLAAMHAGISAADSVCVVMLGLRSADPDHQRAADLLAETGADECEARARQLSALLKKKNLVEYEARRTSAAEARDGVERATRLVQWAGRCRAKGGNVNIPAHKKILASDLFRSGQVTTHLIDIVAVDALAG